MNSKRILIGLCLVFSSFEATCVQGARKEGGCFARLEASLDSFLNRLVTWLISPRAVTPYFRNWSGQKFYHIDPWPFLKIKSNGLKSLERLASFPKFVGPDFKIGEKPLENMWEGEFPGFRFIEEGFKKINPQPLEAQVLTLWPGTTIMPETIKQMSCDSKLHVFLSKDLLKNCRNGYAPMFKHEGHRRWCTWHLPNWWLEMWPALNISSLREKDITSCLVASVPTIVLVEPTNTDGVCQLKKGLLDDQAQILVFGIAAINQGNSPEDQARHLQMLKNMFLVALDNGIEALTMVPPGCGVFGVDRVKMIELIAQALDSLKKHPNFRYFKVYLNTIEEANQAIAKEKFESLGLAGHFELILGTDILLYADLLAQQAKKEGREGIVVATIDLLNPEALIGKTEWNFGYHPTHLSAQRTSAVTTVELASKVHNQYMYQSPIGIPSLADRLAEFASTKRT